jgi:ankyrin repeat protein
MKIKILLFFILLGFLKYIPVHSQEIFEAVKSNNINMLQKIIKKDSSTIFLTDELKRTPLHWAARGVHFELVKYLVENNADINAKDINQITPIASITARNHLSALEYLLNNGANPNVIDFEGDTPLHYAAASGQLRTAQLLLENGASVHIKNSYERTPLVIAVRESGNLEMVKLLIRYGSDINIKDNGQNTALTLAAWRGHKDIVDYLILMNAEVPITGFKAKDLFVYALSKSMSNLYKTILNRGGQIDSLIIEGQTAMHLASKGNSITIVEDLINKGLCVNVQDTFGMYPIHYAAKYGSSEVIKVLIKNGSQINSKSFWGETPYNLAEKAGNNEITSFLKMIAADTVKAENSPIKGIYFGFESPKNKPELFAPGLTSNLVGGHSNVIFSPDGRAACWTEWNLTEKGYANGCKIWYTRIDGDSWKTPEVILQKGDTPFFSSDGNRLYFINYILQPDSNQSKEIYYFDVSGDNVLMEAHRLPFNISNTGLYWQFSFDKDNTIYFGANYHLFKSQLKFDEYEEPENLKEVYHNNYIGGSPFISPNGDYIIFSSAAIGETLGLSDLYIGFKKADGNWTSPVNMGPVINTRFDDHLPIVSGDGKHFFYVTTMNGIKGTYWIDAGIIKELRETAFMLD